MDKNEIQKKRDNIQLKIATDFCNLKVKKALAIVGTGAGKAKIAVMIIQKLKPKKVLFVSESTTNRDITFKAEVKKWDKSLLKKIEYITYQSAYKMDRDLSDYLIISDEADFAFTPKYGEFFKKYNNIPTFAMTGFADDRYDNYKRYLPLLCEITAAELQEAGILNKVKFVFVQFLLGKRKTRTVKYNKFGTNKEFQQSENGAYLHLQKENRKWQAKLFQAEREGDYQGMRFATKHIKEHIPRNKTQLLYTLDSSINLALQIKKELRDKNSDRKVITFSAFTNQAERLSKNAYHGKHPKKEMDKMYANFQSGKIMEMATCKKINRNANIMNLMYAILESYDSSATQIIQRSGRLMRLDPKELAVIYILMPYYTDKEGEIKPTSGVKWAREIFKVIPRKTYALRNYTGRKIKFIK